MGGSTDWTSVSVGVVVSVSWEWRCLDDGYLVIPSPRSIMSNLMLISERGYDVGLVGTEKALQGWLEGLSWRDTVQLALAEWGNTSH